jgi:endonuclease/exonuclease/phosphatase family metal-dependent hydrolase
MKGRVIDVVTCHPWPFSYSFEARKTPAQKESSAKKEGDEYRAFEMWYIVDHTICNPEYAGAEWILVGDMNSISRVDNHRYNLPEDSSQFLTQDVIRTRTDLVDVIGARNPGEFVSSTAKGTRRIDYIYLSPSLDARVRSASIIKETWVPVKYTGISNYWIPSDHLPIVVDLKL